MKNLFLASFLTLAVLANLPSFAASHGSGKTATLTPTGTDTGAIDLPGQHRGPNNANGLLHSSLKGDNGRHLGQLNPNRQDRKGRHGGTGTNTGGVPITDPPVTSPDPTSGTDDLITIPPELTQP